MKRLNGEVIVKLGMVLDYDLPLSECEPVLTFADGSKEQKEAIMDLIRTHGISGDEYVHDFQLANWRDAIGKALIESKRRELKALPEKGQV